MRRATGGVATTIAAAAAVAVWAAAAPGHQEESGAGKTATPPVLRRYVYMVQPDGSTHGGPGSRNGILVLDIDKRFSFVKRITTPDIRKLGKEIRLGLGGGMTGIAACKRTGRYYYSWSERTYQGPPGGIGCLDLKTDELIWERRYDRVCERPQFSRDGRLLYTTGRDREKRGLIAVDAANGDVVRDYQLGPPDNPFVSHPLVVHPDGRRLFCRAGCLDLETGKFLWQMDRTVALGETHIVLDRTATRLYLGRHRLPSTMATAIVDADTGKVLTKVPIDKEKHPDLGGISEVVAFEPGGGHFWGECFLRRDKELFVHLARYDNTTDPPTLDRVVSLEDLNAAHGLKLTWPKGHAMVTGAGDYVWFSCGVVLEARTGKFVCVMTAEDGKFTRGAKFVEVDFIGDEVVWAGQDECHGFIYDDYPLDRVRPLLPDSSPVKRAVDVAAQ
jgi:hypothetical protein